MPLHVVPCDDRVWPTSASTAIVSQDQLHVTGMNSPSPLAPATTNDRISGCGAQVGASPRGSPDNNESRCDATALF